MSVPCCDFPIRATPNGNFLALLARSIVAVILITGVACKRSSPAIGRSGPRGVASGGADS